MQSIAIENILIAHYRVNGTDGVGLEIEKRKKLLEERGYNVFLLAGSDSDFVIPELSLDHPSIKGIQRVVDGDFSQSDYSDETAFKEAIDIVAHSIEQQLLDILKEGIDMMYVHNIASRGNHFPAAIAFQRAVKESGVLSVAIDHDFYWEGGLIAKPSDFVGKLLQENHVWRTSNVRHVAINSINQKNLEAIGIDAVVNYDTIDFNNPPELDDYNGDLRHRLGYKENDLIILHATRIIPRKAIELAIDFVAELQSQRNQMHGKKLYNGQTFTEDSKIVLLFSNFTENGTIEYESKLRERMDAVNIGYRFVFEMVGQERENGKYSFLDFNPHADLITFPSVWEGYGNQFLEAILSKKPVVVFEHPVFEEDILPQGYEVISLGNTVRLGPDSLYVVDRAQVVRTVQHAIETLLDNERYTRMVDRNFSIGAQNHGYEQLTQYLSQDLEWASSVRK